MFAIYLGFSKIYNDKIAITYCEKEDDAIRVCEKLFLYVEFKKNLLKIQNDYIINLPSLNIPNRLVFPVVSDMFRKYESICKTGKATQEEKKLFRKYQKEHIDALNAYKEESKKIDILGVEYIKVVDKLSKEFLDKINTVPKYLEEVYCYDDYIDVINHSSFYFEYKKIVIHKSLPTG